MSAITDMFHSTVLTQFLTQNRFALLLEWL